MLPTARKVLVLLVLMVFSIAARAALVRGRLLRGQSPAPGIPVTVWCQPLGRSVPVYSGADGMYYIPNVPQGQYVLEIWAVPNGAPITFVINIIEPGTDVNPIYVP